MASSMGRVIRGVDVDRGVGDLGHQVDGQTAQGNDADNNDDQGDHRRKDGAANGNFG
jgi:hypothetical protein